MLGRVLSFPFEMQTHKAERVVAFFFEVQSRKTSFMDANEGRILAQLWFPLKVCRYHIEWTAPVSEVLQCLRDISALLQRK